MYREEKMPKKICKKPKYASATLDVCTARKQSLRQTVRQTLNTRVASLKQRLGTFSDTLESIQKQLREFHKEILRFFGDEAVKGHRRCQSFG